MRWPSGGARWPSGGATWPSDVAQWPRGEARWPTEARWPSVTQWPSVTRWPSVMARWPSEGHGGRNGRGVRVVGRSGRVVGRRGPVVGRSGRAGRGGRPRLPSGLERRTLIERSEFESHRRRFEYLASSFTPFCLSISECF